MIRFTKDSKREFIIDKPILLAEITNLKNYISEIEYQNLFDLAWKSDLKELNKRIEEYKNFNIGKSKYHLQFLLGSKPRKLLTTSLILKTGIRFFNFRCWGGRDEEKPISGFLKTKDELIIGFLINYILTDFITFKMEMGTLNKTGILHKSFILSSSDLFFNTVMLYYSYRLNLLDKWITIPPIK